MQRWCLYFFVLLAMATAGCDLVKGSDGSTEELSIAVDDTLRQARLYVPDGIAPGQPVHLLIALHGSGDNGANFQAGAELQSKIPEDMVVAYPTAAKGNWAEGCNCNIADRLQINDLGFIEALIEEVADRYSVAPQRTYALGYSQGGLFAYRLGCAMSDKISSVVAISAPMSEPLSWACRTDHPTSVMAIHGRRDNVLPWAGTDNGALSLLSAPETALFWKEKRSCGDSITSRHRSGTATVVGTEWNDCEEGSKVHLYEMTDGVHAWYTDSPDVREFVFDFLPVNRP